MARQKGSWGNDDYVDVAARIRQFRDKYPDGCLQPAIPAEPFTVVTIGGREFVAYTAAAYRTPDDDRPGIGVAWEPFPGPTPFTRDSELMNAETSAWGRAIIAVGAADAKKLASAEEVRNRQAPVWKFGTTHRDLLWAAFTKTPAERQEAADFETLLEYASQTEASFMSSLAKLVDAVNTEAATDTEPEPAVWSMSDRERARLMALCIEAGVDDKLRHQITGLVTDGRTVSTKDMTQIDYQLVLQVVELIKTDEIVVSLDPEGQLALAKPAEMGGSPADLAAMRTHFEQQGAANG